MFLFGLILLLIFLYLGMKISYALLRKKQSPGVRFVKFAFGIIRNWFTSKEAFDNFIIDNEHVEVFNNDTQLEMNALWQYVEDTLIFYNGYACQCAFPRYRQIVAIDCYKVKGLFYCSETEAFIKLSEKYFDIEPLDNQGAARRKQWTCKKCGSTFIWTWNELGYDMDRTVLHVQKLIANDIGDVAASPIPLYIGIHGVDFKGPQFSIKTDFQTFKDYVRKLKPVKF